MPKRLALSLADQDKLYLDIFLHGLRATRSYKPKLGTGSSVNVTEFALLYGSDPLYAWIGFDSHLMYAAHRASGAMTSLYRNLGTGCEHLFKALLKDELGLSDSQIKWEYRASAITIDPAGEGSTPSNRGRSTQSGTSHSANRDEDGNRGVKNNSLDGRIDISEIAYPEKIGAVKEWITLLQRQQDVTWDPLGAVFEVRQGYKSMDSKRQSADIANAAQALTRQRIPVLVVFSSQIDDVLVKRYKAHGWGLLRGITAGTDARNPLESTFAFSKDVLGYDLAAFFERNTSAIRAEVESILQDLLRTAK
jgi:hypothetical protein